MAIAYDNATDGNYASGTSLTYSHTVGTGSNRILFVTTTGQVSTDAITGITYAGQAMTLLAKKQGDGSTVSWTYLYYLLNPASGANNVVVSASSSTVIESGAVSYSGVAQVTPEAYASSQVETSSTYSLTVTTVSDNDWTVAGIASNNGGSTAGSGTTKRVASNAYALYDSNGPITPAGSTSLNFSHSGNSNWVGVIAAFAPAGSSTTFSRAAALSMMNGASRSATAQRVWHTARSATVTMMNAAARVASAVFHLPVHFARTASVSMMNASSRYATAVARVTVVWVRTASVTMMNAASRFASATKSFIIKIGSTIRWDFWDWD